MQVRKNVVALKDGSVFPVDLSDFPHGDMVSVRKDDKYDIEFYSVPDGVKVASYDEITGKPEFHDVKYWSVHRGKPIEIVNLDDGKQIITDNDPRAVYGISSKSEKIEFGRFTPSEAMDSNVLVPVADSELSSDISGLYYSFGDGVIGENKYPYCVPMDFSFGQFVGVMVGDGWSDIDFNSYLSDNEGFNIKFVSDFLKSIFPGFYATGTKFSATEYDDRYGDTVRYRLNNAGGTLLGERIKELVDGHGDAQTSGSANKRLPIWYQFAGKDFILGLVNGMIATDGTACVSHGKKTPQLQISFSSTSLRLVREFKRCCQLLGVYASISFSKNTSGGNKSWLCSVSTIDAKKTHLLERCCHERKRDVFLNTYVNVSDKCVKNDIVPFPIGVAKRIIYLVPAAKSQGIDKSSIPEDELRRRMKYQSVAINVRRQGKAGFCTRALVRMVKDIGDEIADRNCRLFDVGSRVLRVVEGRFDELLSSDKGGSRREWKVPMSVEEADDISAMIASVKPRFCEGWMYELRSTTNALYNIRRKGFVTWAQLGEIKNVFKKYGHPNTELRDSKDLADMMRLVESDVTWLRIKSVEKTGQVEIGYDLTVPGPDTFVSDDGIVLSNTVNIHVPASDKAAKQALDKMLPSKNLFSLTDLKSVRYKPEKEQISGLWALTRGRTRKPTRVFQTKAEATAAYRNGEIGPNDPVEIIEIKE